MKWEEIPLGEVITLQRGYDLPEQQRVSGSVPVISSSGVTGYHNEARESGIGVVTGRYGTLGEVFYIEGDYWPHNTTLFVKDFKGNNPLFVKYLLMSLNLRHKVSSGAVPGVNRNILHAMHVPNVPRARQDAIAFTLKNYDDLIENNLRRIALLEEAARLLYQEWFVRLRFPGFEHTRIVDGVPEGWERNKIDSLCTEIKKSVNPMDIETDTPYIGLEHMPRRSISLSEWGRADEVASTKHEFKQGDIIFGKIRPYFHKVGVAFVDGVASSDAIVIRPSKDEYYSLLLMTLSSDNFVAYTSKTVKEGSKMPRADWNMMRIYPVNIPPLDILKDFNANISSIVRQLNVLAQQNMKLKQSRDLLLPKLMSGEVKV